MDAEILKLKEKNTSLSDELKRFKSEIKEKDESIDSLQKRVTRLNAVSELVFSILSLIYLDLNINST